MNEKIRKVLHSSKSDEWSTPLEFYEKLNSEFSFTLDPCATDENHKCSKYFTIEDNGLKQSWAKEVVFMNPPYSNVKEWMEKACEERKGAVIVALLPSRTDTKWFHNYCIHAKEIRFVKGRLKFGDSKNSAPFPSMIVVFDGVGQSPTVRFVNR
tara:strand:- start:27389 stop:27850 length:462 start_codon:yes stop_codon:yes gene_type:complete